MFQCKQKSAAEADNFSAEFDQNEQQNRAQPVFQSMPENNQQLVIQDQNEQDTGAQDAQENNDDVHMTAVNQPEQWPELLEGNQDEEEQHEQEQLELTSSTMDLQLTNQDLQRSHTTAAQKEDLEQSKIYNQQIQVILKHQFDEPHEITYLSQENKVLMITVLEFLAYKLKISPRDLIEQIQDDQVTLLQLDRELAKLYIADSKLNAYYNLLFFQLPSSKILKFSHTVLLVIISWLLSHHSYVLLEVQIRKYIQANFQLQKISQTNANSESPMVQDYALSDLKENISRYNRNIVILQTTILDELQQIHQVLSGGSQSEELHLNTQLSVIRTIFKNFKRGTEQEFSVVREVQEQLDSIRNTANNQNSNITDASNVMPAQNTHQKSNYVYHDDKLDLTAKTLMQSELKKSKLSRVDATNKHNQRKLEQLLTNQKNSPDLSNNNVIEKRLTHPREIIEKKLWQKKFRYQREIDYVKNKKVPATSQSLCRYEQLHFQDKQKKSLSETDYNALKIRIGLRPKANLMVENQSRRQQMVELRQSLLQVERHAHKVVHLLNE